MDHAVLLDVVSTRGGKFENTERNATFVDSASTAEGMSKAYQAFLSNIPEEDFFSEVPINDRRDD